LSDIWERLSKLSAAKRSLLLSQLQAGPLQKLTGVLTKQLTPMTVEQMDQEAVLDPSVTVSQSSPARDTPESILLTGATGFLGAFLLEALIQQSTATIYCLVRAANCEVAKERLFRNLSTYFLDGTGRDRIVPLIGDLSIPRLGLNDRDFEQLANDIDVIYHCGAVVKWTYPFRALKPANVVGTHEILRLAVHRRLKPLHFISTVGVFSSPDYRASKVLESELLNNSGPLYVGYAQTKWVAEKLVTIARSRGLPVSIYRPNLTGDSRTGVFNPHDHISLLIKACIQLGFAPELNLRVFGAPVDYVSRAIISLSQMPASRNATYHLVNPKGIAWNDLSDWFASQGYRIRKIPYVEWRKILLESIRTKRDNALLGLSPFVSEHAFDYTRLPHFDCSNTLGRLELVKLVCPELDNSLLNSYLSYYRSVNFLPAPGD
jgi:thioester reductase-like protein